MRKQIEKRKVKIKIKGLEIELDVDTAQTLQNAIREALSQKGILTSPKGRSSLSGDPERSESILNEERYSAIG